MLLSLLHIQFLFMRVQQDQYFGAIARLNIKKTFITAKLKFDVTIQTEHKILRVIVVLVVLDLVESLSSVTFRAVLIVAMLSSTISFAVHLYSSLQGVQTLGRALGYVLPYSNMAAVKVKRNFNTKHLTKGDALPPFTGKLRVYNMRYCPFAQRTILALNAKDVDYEIVNVDLQDKPEWLTTVSAFGKVPALEISKGVSVLESLVTVEYLDDIYPQRPLLPKDPLLKAKDKVLVEAFSAVHALYFKLVRGPDTITEDNIAAYFRAIDMLQSELTQRGTKFLDGEQPGYGDYMIWPWFERLLVINSDVGRLDEKKYKLVLAYIENLGKDPVIADYKLPTEALLAFQNAYRLKQKPNYDLLLEE